MTQKIFKNIFFVSILTFIASYVIIMGVLYDYFEKQLKDELKSEIQYISQGIRKSGAAYFDDFKGGNRTTWIDTDGTVLFDSEVDSSDIENHSNREEFIEAVDNGEGEAIRYSKTIAQRTMYYAIALEDGTVIRVSTRQNSVFMLMLSMIQPTLFVFTIVVVLSLIIALKLSKRILKPINELNLDSPQLEENYEEVAPLINKINRQNKLIESQMKELKKKQEEFSQITENMKEGFIVIDSNTDILSYNKAAFACLGHSLEEKPKSVFELNRSAEFRNAIDLALKGINADKILNYAGKSYEIIANTVKNLEKDKIDGAIIIIIDITEKEERERLRREFSSNVSHELKTPLTSIYGMSEMLMLNMVKEDDVTLFGKKIHEETGRLVSLVEDILKISQLDEGLVNETKEQLDLYAMSSDIVNRLQAIASKRNISIELDGEHIKINGVYRIIEEMIYNLCDNAIKYNVDNGKITITIKENNIGKIIEVSDTGIGIPEADKERIFERFYRVDKSHSKKIGGTGLGLSIVKHAAAYHNAIIDIESELDKGTKITIIFK